MGPSIRAKFRVLSIKQSFDGSIVAELRPVWQKGKNSAENERFWKASPSGECTLVFHRQHDLVLGAYYYIDMTRYYDSEKVEDAWSLGGVSKRGKGSGTVDLSYYKNRDWSKPTPVGLLSGDIKISIDGEHTDALKSFGEPVSQWRVEFTFAEASDDV